MSSPPGMHLQNSMAMSLDNDSVLMPPPAVPGHFPAGHHGGGPELSEGDVLFNN